MNEETNLFQVSWRRRCKEAVLSEDGNAKKGMTDESISSHTHPSPNLSLCLSGVFVSLRHNAGFRTP